MASSGYSEIPGEGSSSGGGVYTEQPRRGASVRRFLRNYSCCIGVTAVVTLVVLALCLLGIMLYSDISGDPRFLSVPNPNASLITLMALNWPRRDHHWYKDRWSYHFKEKHRRSPHDGDLEPFLKNPYHRHWTKNDGSTFPKNDTWNWMREPKELPKQDEQKISESLAKGSKEMLEIEKLEQRIAYRKQSLKSGCPAHTHQNGFKYTSPIVKVMEKQGYLMEFATRELKSSLDLNREQVTFDSRFVMDLKDTPYCDTDSYKKKSPCDPTIPYRQADGSCNNLKNPHWGASMNTYRREMPPDYADGISAPRTAVDGSDLPSARLISTIIFADIYAESRSYTHLTMTWGQFVDHDITGTAATKGLNGATIRCCPPGTDGSDLPKETSSGGHSVALFSEKGYDINIENIEQHYGPSNQRQISGDRSRKPTPVYDLNLEKVQMHLKPEQNDQGGIQGLADTITAAIEKGISQGEAKRMTMGTNQAKNPVMIPGGINQGINQGMNQGMNQGRNQGINQGISPGMKPGMNQRINQQPVMQEPINQTLLMLYKKDDGKENNRDYHKSYKQKNNDYTNWGSSSQGTDWSTFGQDIAASITKAVTKGMGNGNMGQEMNQQNSQRMMQPASNSQQSSMQQQMNPQIPMNQQMPMNQPMRNQLLNQPIPMNLQMNKPITINQTYPIPQSNMNINQPNLAQITQPNNQAINSGMGQPMSPSQLVPQGMNQPMNINQPTNQRMLPVTQTMQPNNQGINPMMGPLNPNMGKGIAQMQSMNQQQNQNPSQQYSQPMTNQQINQQSNQPFNSQIPNTMNPGMNLPVNSRKKRGSKDDPGRNKPIEIPNEEEFENHPQCYPIEVPEDDGFFHDYDVTCMEFIRSSPAPRCHFGPREQVNQLTSYIDGSVIYGTSQKQLEELRTFNDGLLKTQVTLDGRELLPASLNLNDSCNIEKQAKYNRFCFKSGDSRINENMLITIMHTIWMRQHNLVSLGLKDANPHWDDELLFQEARKIVTAQLQHITYQEYVPSILGPAFMEALDISPREEGQYRKDYNPRLDASIANEFAAAAFRFGHSQIQGLVQRIDGPMKNINFEQLKKNFFNPFGLYDTDLAPEYVRGMGAQSAAAVDTFFTSQVTNRLFQASDGKFGMDLAALNIQRGRDHGLPGYTRWRMYCGLPPARNFSDLQFDMDQGALKALMRVYKHVDDIDLFAGGLAERPVEDGLVGPTFACMLGDQFYRLQKGDRFWYETDQKPQAFTNEQLAQIHKTSLARILCDNTGSLGSIQRWPLRLYSTGNPRLPCSSALIPSLNLGPWEEGDFF